MSLYLPALVIRISGLEFPSRDGKVLLGFQAKNLGIHVKGVDYA